MRGLFGGIKELEFIFRVIFPGPLSSPSQSIPKTKSLDAAVARAWNSKQGAAASLYKRNRREN